MKMLYEDDDYSLQPARLFWGFIFSVLERDFDPRLNFTVHDKKHGASFRLTNEEHIVFEHIGELMVAFSFTPEMLAVDKSSKERWRKAITREFIDVVIEGRSGNTKPLDQFAKMKIDDFANDTVR